MLHNGSTYVYHFIIKELAKEFKGKFECLDENTEKYITFSLPIEKEGDNGKPIVYKIKFLDSFSLTLVSFCLALLIVYQTGYIILNAKIVTHFLIT